MQFDPSLLEMIAATTKNGGRIIIEGTRIEIIPSEAPKSSEDPSTASTSPEAPEAPYGRTHRLKNPNTGKFIGTKIYYLDRMNKNELKILEAMKICVAEGWHLWEMQFALYCADHRLNPANTSRISLAGLKLTYDTMNYKFWYVRESFTTYARTKRASVIAKLNAL